MNEPEVRLELELDLPAPGLETPCINTVCGVTQFSRDVFRAEPGLPTVTWTMRLPGSVCVCEMQLNLRLYNSYFKSNNMYCKLNILYTKMLAKIL